MTTTDTIADERVGDKIKALARDIRAGREVVHSGEARFLVDLYYQMQRDRIRAGNQSRAFDEAGEPAVTTALVLGDFETMELRIKQALDAYTTTTPVGTWARSVPGVGPVLCAGLLAHLNMDHCPTVGHLWAFAGLDPTKTWAKGQKRPWNGRLKVLCWKLGESFVKVSGRESDIYGKVYRARKEYEVEKNLRGDYAEQARRSLETKKFGDDTVARKAYERGRLPDARIHLRCQRYAVKLFLSHLHHVAHLDAFGTPPPKPYIIEHGGHVHFVEPPNMDVFRRASERVGRSDQTSTRGAP